MFGDVRDESGWRHLLDADVVLGCTDTHASRAALNNLASGYLLPVIDVGTKAGAHTNADLAVLVAEVSVLTVVTPCLGAAGGSLQRSSEQRTSPRVSGRNSCARATS